MSEDQLLHELGHLAREAEEAEQVRFDERWDRLAAGTLTPEEDAELRALAESSPELREIYEAFRPLGAEFQARIVKEIAGDLQQAKPETQPQKTRPRLLPFRPTTLRWTGWLTAAAAAAASLFLLLPSPATMPPLPVYIAERPTGGIQTFRGEEKPAGPPIFAPGSLVTLIVRPQHPVTGPVEARAFLARGGELVLWEPRPEIKKGSVRLRGKLSREIRPGNWRLWIVIGRPGKMPPMTELQDALRAGRTRHDSWEAVHAELRVANHSPP